MPQELPLNPKPHPAQATYDLQKAARQDAFLQAYAQCGTIRKACEAVGLQRNIVHIWQRDDPLFQERMHEAHAQFADLLQDYALQKVERLESKDNLLHLAMLNAHVPQLYAPERQRFVMQDNRSVTIVNNFATSPREIAPEYVEAEIQELTGSDASSIADTVTDTDNE